MAELQKDPDFQLSAHKQEQERRAGAEEYAVTAAPLLGELAAAGFQVKTVGQLRQSRANYKGAIDVLLRWLPRVGDEHLKEDIVRTLSVPWAKPEAVVPLINEFKKVNDPSGTGLRWAIANALEVLADDRVLDDIVALVQEPAYGKSRQMLALALAKMKDPRVIPVLLNLLDDEEVVGHAAIALGTLRAQSARDRIEALTKHGAAWVRKEAKKALAKIDATRK
jgi:hypothetical protein